MTEKERLDHSRDRNRGTRYRRRSVPWETKEHYEERTKK